MPKKVADFRHAYQWEQQGEWCIRERPHACDVNQSQGHRKTYRRSAQAKDRIPTHHCSNLIYLFKCRCDKRYVGKTTQRLEARIAQHIPASLTRKRSDGSNQDAKTTSAIGEHLVKNAACLDSYNQSMFSIICTARTTSSLHVLEALYIKKIRPELCKQMEFVKCLDLFPT